MKISQTLVIGALLGLYTNFEVQAIAFRQSESEDLLETIDMDLEKTHHKHKHGKKGRKHHHHSHMNVQLNKKGEDESGTDPMDRKAEKTEKKADKAEKTEEKAEKTEEKAEKTEEKAEKAEKKSDKADKKDDKEEKKDSKKDDKDDKEEETKPSKKGDKEEKKDGEKDGKTAKVEEVVVEKTVVKAEVVDNSSTRAAAASKIEKKNRDVDAREAKDAKLEFKEADKVYNEKQDCLEGKCEEPKVVAKPAAKPAEIDTEDDPTSNKPKKGSKEAEKEDSKATKTVVAPADTEGSDKPLVKKVVKEDDIFSDAKAAAAAVADRKEKEGEMKTAVNDRYEAKYMDEKRQQEAWNTDMQYKSKVAAEKIKADIAIRVR